jgi:hypothetical protein
MASKSKLGPSEYQLIGLAEDGNIGDLLDGMDEKQSRLRVQAMIAEWLRMENLVVLTGAGTSVSSEGKTMANLEGAILATLEESEDIPAPVRTILEDRKVDIKNNSKRATSFEDWISYIANALYLTKVNSGPISGVSWRSTAAPSSIDIEWLFNRLSRAIFAECALLLPSLHGTVTSGKVPPHLAFLSKAVSRDSNLGRTHLFTLNYDTLFEQALELLGIQYFDGFTGRAEARFDPSVYGLDIYYPGEIAEGRVRRLDRFLHLYKLHGSIHWFEHDGEMRARHPDLAPFKDYRSLTPAKKAEALWNLTKSVPAVGILPTANKFAQTLAMPFAHLFRSLQIRLGVPQTFLLVLGYGFGDEHISRIIETALMNPSLVMLVVEPNPDSPVIKRIQGYKDLGKRAFVLCPTGTSFVAKKFEIATFDDFSQAIMPNVRWLEDFLRLRRFEKQIASSGSASVDPNNGQ